MSTKVSSASPTVNCDVISSSKGGWPGVAAANRKFCKDFASPSVEGFFAIVSPQSC